MFNIFDKIKEFFSDMLIDVIKENLSGMLLDINDKVATIGAEVGKTPSAWNSEVFTFIKSISENVILPIAALIITAVLCIELIQTVMNKNNLHEVDTFDFFKYVIKMWIAVWLVSHAFDFSMAVFDVAQSLIGKAAGVVNITAKVSPGDIDKMVEVLKESQNIGQLLVIAIETAIVKLVIQAISILITVILYGRMIEIYIYSSVCAIPFATMGNKEWGSIGTNYIKGLFALGLQGLFLLICVGIYSILVKTLNITDIHKSIFELLGYTLILGITMMKSGSMAKSILNAH